MQILCGVPGGIKSYLENPDCLDCEAIRPCPFCQGGHRLWRHGRYSRYALLPGFADEPLIPILRLLCHRTGQTVSLLPDFCIPRRQIGPAILGLFLHVLVSTATEIGSALASVMGRQAARSTAQSLLRGFRRREASLLAYLSSLHARAPEGEPSCPVAGRRPLARLVCWLLHPPGCDPAATFVELGRGFHVFAAAGLA